MFRHITDPLDLFMSHPVLSRILRQRIGAVCNVGVENQDKPGQALCAHLREKYGITRCLVAILSCKPIRHQQPLHREHAKAGQQGI
jgi:hypothetical protein